MKTVILCMASEPRHVIDVADNGDIDCTCGSEAVASAARLAALIRLGRPHDAGPGCVSFIALYEHGLQSMIDHKSFGAWRRLYMRYETNKLVIAKMDRIYRDRERALAPTYAAARQALRKTAVRRDFSKADLDELTTFHGDTAESELLGYEIAGCREDSWEIPLQKGWLESVHDAGIAVVSGRFVCGVNTQRPGFVYAITKDEDGVGYTVGEFFLNSRTKQLGKVAA